MDALDIAFNGLNYIQLFRLFELLKKAELPVGDISDSFLGSRLSGFSLTYQVFTSNLGGKNKIYFYPKQISVYNSC